MGELSRVILQEERPRALESSIPCHQCSRTKGYFLGLSLSQVGHITRGSSKAKIAHYFWGEQVVFG